MGWNIDKLKTRQAKAAAIAWLQQKRVSKQRSRTETFFLILEESTEI